ncbi:MAG: 3-phosphoshikimate 1-carboxyvinyltransferase [Gemmatimonadetes bacterium]|nr:3-phosphoshikimate 1-carboxyvinyltransferase [Gemmatimonadota bacterium]
MRVSGRLRVPGDKSISHRALMFAALGDGVSRIEGLLPSADVHSTAGMLRALGVDVPAVTSDAISVRGVGLRGLRASAAPLDGGNSGTTTRLMAGILAASPFASRVIGDASLSKRPMRRVAQPLTAMGARFEFEQGDGLPMTIHGGALQGITWRSEAASAQVKSAILLAGLVAGVPVEVHEPAATRDHSERMLRGRGIDVRSEGTTVSLVPGPALRSLDARVTADPSSATFFAALAALASSGEIEIEGVCTNPTRTGAFIVLERMGARLGWEDVRDEGGESVATLVAAPRRLVGTVIEPAEVPSLIDELPMLACVAARAAGETRVTGAAELRVKESDRISTVVRNLVAVGADAEELPDGFVVRGGDRPLAGRVVTHGDHRIAMAFGVLGALPGNQIEIDDPDCVAVSYPTFWSDLSRVRA